MPDASTPPANWADTAASLLSKLTGGVELACTFDQIEVQVPGPQGAPATWRVNGSLRIRTRGGEATSTPPKLG